MYKQEWISCFFCFHHFRCSFLSYL